MLIFEIQGIGWDLSMTRISYKLMKRTTKSEKFEKSLKMYDIINFQTIRYRLTALCKIFHLIVNYKFTRPVSILRLPKEKKALTENSKKLSEKSVKAIREWTFQRKSFLFSVNF